MKKLVISFTIGLAVFLYCSIELLSNKIKEEKSRFKKEVGHEIILEKDTLTVIDYDSWSETFTLSDGKEVDASIVFGRDSVIVE